jgi:DNA-binding response OmpR family regulator
MTVFRWQSLTLLPDYRQLFVEEKPIYLTRREFDLLQLLISNPHQVFSRTQILKVLGSNDGVGADHIVDTHASRLRLKIVAGGGPRLVQAVHAIGFKLAARQLR